MDCQRMVLCRMNFLDNKSYTMAFSVGDVEKKKTISAEWKLAITKPCKVEIFVSHLNIKQNE